MLSTRLAERKCLEATEGSLEVEKLADLVALDRDPITVTKGKIAIAMRRHEFDEHPCEIAQHPRLRWTGWAFSLALLAPFLVELPAMAQAGADNLQNSSNDPLTPKMAFELHNYAQPLLMGRPSSGADQGFLRLVLPHDVLDVDQMMRVSMPVVSSSWDPQGAVNGVGDLTAFDLAVFHFGSAKVGVGPLVVVPTASAPALGASKWQAGAQTVVSAPHSWGLTTMLASYQQTFDGKLQTLTVQPLLFYNLGDGFYLRSTGISSFDLGKNAVVPVGLGLGRVFELPSGASINTFIEPQYSVVQSGLGVPSFQIFAGVVVQLPLKPH